MQCLFDLILAQLAARALCHSQKIVIAAAVFAYAIAVCSQESASYAPPLHG
jgi:hypothetical protein